MRGFGTLAAAFVITVLLGGTAAAQPVYNIVDIGVLAGDSSSQGFFVSPNGIATGRSITGSFSSTHAYSWTQGGGIVGLPNLASPSRPFGVGNGVNNSGRIVGFGIDPNNAAVNVGYVLDTSTNNAFSVGALPGFNGAICFGVSNGGHVVGSSMLNQGSGLPFIYTDANGIMPIPLAA